MFAVNRELVQADGFKIFTNKLVFDFNTKCNESKKRKIKNIEKVIKPDKFSELEFLNLMKDRAQDFSIETLQKHLGEWNNAFEVFGKNSNDGLSRDKNVIKTLTEKIAKNYPNYPFKFIQSFVRQRSFKRMKHITEQFKKEETARSKKQKVDLTETV